MVKELRDNMGNKIIHDFSCLSYTDPVLYYSVGSG